MLSSDEERHIQNLSVIPTAIVVYICIGYFVYLARSNLSLSFLFCAIYFGVTFSLAMPLTFILAETVLISRKTKRPIKSYAKQFLGGMSIIILGSTMFWIVFGTVYLTLSSLLDEAMLVVLIAAICFAIWLALVFRYRERFGKLSKGDW